LPLGIQVSETIIPEGQNAAWLSITANDTGDRNSRPNSNHRQSQGGHSRNRASRTATTVLWDVPDYNNDRSFSPDATIDAGDQHRTTPLTVEPKQTSWQVPQATQFHSIAISPRADFKQPIKLRAYLDNQNDPLKEWQIDGNASDSTFDLDVKGAKLSNGAHQLFFLAQTPANSTIRADEVAALEAEAKQAESKKDDTKKKEIESRFQLRDVSAIFSSPIVKSL
jgi:hypothetical protein